MESILGACNGIMEQENSLPDILKQPLVVRRYRAVNSGDDAQEYHVTYADGSEETVTAGTAYEASKKATGSGDIVRIYRKNLKSESLVEKTYIKEDDAIEIGFAEHPLTKDGCGSTDKFEHIIVPAPDTTSVDFLANSDDSMPHEVPLSDMDEQEINPPLSRAERLAGDGETEPVSADTSTDTTEEELSTPSQTEGLSAEEVEALLNEKES